MSKPREVEVVDLRLSAHKMGTLANPRLLWSLSVGKKFLQTIPEDLQKVKLRQEDGRLWADLGSEGVRLSWAKDGQFARAGTLGEHHLRGIMPPEDEMPAHRLKGEYQPGSLKIQFSQPLPREITSRFIDVEAKRAEASVEHHFPGREFANESAPE